VLHRLLDIYWPGHPRHFFIGSKGWNLPGEVLDPGGDPHDGKNWSWMLLQGVRKVREMGYSECYLIAEEHLPLGPCHKIHLEESIPNQARQLGAKYIGLMGWDNRRFPIKSPVLSKEMYLWKHLSAKKGPRFHLHPAYWDLQTLEECCNLALEDVTANGSAWHFEKACGDFRAPLPVQDCYQICGGAMSLHPPSSLVPRLISRWFYLKLMALIPHLPHSLRKGYFDLMRFDQVFCDGPYPMIFSGALAKGKMNPSLVRMKRLIHPVAYREVISAFES
jgi:hypothetical protein